MLRGPRERRKTRTPRGETDHGGNHEELRTRRIYCAHSGHRGRARLARDVRRLGWVACEDGTRSDVGDGNEGRSKERVRPRSNPFGRVGLSGSAAPVRVSARPRFVYQLRPNQSISERDLVLVRTDQKSDHREIRVAKVGSWTANTRTGFDQKKLIPIAVTRKGETIEIVPNADLDVGEYFVTAGFSPVGFDFGVGGR